MIRKTVVCFCLLFFCIATPIRAGTLSGNGDAVSFGQTKVTAQVAAAEETLPGDGAGDALSPNGYAEVDGAGDALSPNGYAEVDSAAEATTGNVPSPNGGNAQEDTSRAEGLRRAVRSGDLTRLSVLSAVFAVSGIIIVVLIRRWS